MCWFGSWISGYRNVLASTTHGSTTKYMYKPLLSRLCIFVFFVIFWKPIPAIYTLTSRIRLLMFQRSKEGGSCMKHILFTHCYLAGRYSMSTETWGTTVVTALSGHKMEVFHSGNQKRAKLCSPSNRHCSCSTVSLICNQPHEQLFLLNSGPLWIIV